MRQLTKSYDRKIAGVAGGFADYYDMDKTLMRALWVLGIFVMPPVVLLYLILAAALPSAPAPGFAPPRTDDIPPADPYTAPRSNYRRLTKSQDRWLSGVCGGIAEYFDIDPVLVRALFLGAFLLMGTGLLAYIILAVLMPRPQYTSP